MAISWTNNYITATINMPSPLGKVSVTGASATFTVPKVQVKATGSYIEPPCYLGLGQERGSYSSWGDAGNGLQLKNGSTTIKTLRGHSSKSVAKNTYVDIAYSASASVTLTTSSYFKSSNANQRTVTLDLVAPSGCIVGVYEASIGGSSFSTNPSQKTLSTITLELNVPPTATVGSLTTDTAYVYAGLTTASVSVSNATAYYGGTIVSVTLTIGGQSASISGDGTLSILLNAGGTFTPVVTITDSRGQVQEYQLDPITVGIYSAPTVNFDAERTTDTGVLDDEGAYATIVTTLTFDPIAEAVAPTVAVADEDGITQTVTTTWYSTRASDGTLSGAVTWSTLASGSTVYGLVSITGGFDTQKSYVISLTPQDSESITGDTKTDTLQTAFYTVDFLAGGHGIAFGMPASQDGFYCKMPATFVDANDVMRALFDFIHPVGSYYETSDTTFDPNVTWGGTWSLETEGQVHISAGANYTVAGALTNTTDGGETEHKLTTTEIPSHNHGSSGAHTHTLNLRNAGTSGSRATNNVTYGASGHDYQNDNPFPASNGAHTHTSVGGNGAHNNMQPYIIVNRWHRTA